MSHSQRPQGCLLRTGEGIAIVIVAFVIAAPFSIWGPVTPKGPIAPLVIIACGFFGLLWAFGANKHLARWLMLVLLFVPAYWVLWLVLYHAQVPAT